MPDTYEVRSNYYGRPSTIAIVPKDERDRRWPRPGDRLRFLARNGYDHEREAALEVMSPGDVFTVADCKVDNWMHWVRFEEVDGEWNGVMFERVDEADGMMPDEYDPDDIQKALADLPPVRKRPRLHEAVVVMPDPDSMPRIIAWVPEDELPESLPQEAYDALYPYSRVDIIRWFPVFAPTQKEKA